MENDDSNSNSENNSGLADENLEGSNKPRGKKKSSKEDDGKGSGPAIATKDRIERMN